MKKVFLVLPVLIFAFLIYYIVNTLNPDSYFCSYKIYKQADSAYEVWYYGRTAWRIGSFQTYDEAKAFQIKECKKLKDFMLNHPNGQRVK